MLVASERIRKKIRDRRLELAFEEAYKKAEAAYAEFIATRDGEIYEAASTMFRNRIARCDCGSEAPSSPDLPFFQYRGPGSKEASRICIFCGRLRIEHKLSDGCKRYRGGKAMETDSYFCGCRGFE